MARSILSAAGMPDLCTDDDDQFVQAVRSMSDRAALVEVRGQLRERLRRSPLTDARRFTRDFEHCLDRAWSP